MGDEQAPDSQPSATVKGATERATQESQLEGAGRNEAEAQKPEENRTPRKEPSRRRLRPSIWNMLVSPLLSLPNRVRIDLSGLDGEEDREALTPFERLAEVRQRVENARQFQKLWLTAFWIGLPLLVTLCVTSGLFAAYGRPWFDKAPLIIGAGGAYVLGFFLFGAATGFQRVSRRRTELAVLEARIVAQQKLAGPSPLAEVTATSSGGDGDVYFDRLVDINVDNLGRYYGLVKDHTDNSFRATLWVGIVGFLFILIGLTVGIFAGADRRYVAYTSAAAGVLTEFIAAIFFYLYNKTVAQLKDYHDSLLSVQNILLSFKIIGEQERSPEKLQMVAQMVRYLVGDAKLPSTSSPLLNRASSTRRTPRKKAAASRTESVTDGAG